MPVADSGGIAAQGRIGGAQPVAVLDIGSNSVRLVVYERLARALTPLYNEKAPCTLGRGVATTGRMADEYVALALTAIQRFALVCRLIGVKTVYALATSAVREASNGKAFADKVTELMGAPVQVLSGAEEAHFAAMGVVAGIPAFQGVVGDLGGGSLELSEVAEGEDNSDETHSLGVIRLQDECGNDLKKVRRLVRARLKESDIVGGARGRSFCAIGGTWRALARLHQIRTGYPLHMVQSYTIGAGSAVELCTSVIGAVLAGKPVTGAEFVSSSRRDLLGHGAVALREVIRAGGFKSICFSALGVREGYLYGQLSTAQKTMDPLMLAAEEIAVLTARSPVHARDLIGFTAKFFSDTGITETPAGARLRAVASLLADISWRGHPDYRGEQAVDMVAFGSLTGVSHSERAFLAQVLAVRYMGLKHKCISGALLDLAGAKATARARLIGALFRVAFPMSAAMPGVLPRIGFSSGDGMLVLRLPADLAFLDGLHLENRLNQLAGAAGFARSQTLIF